MIRWESTYGGGWRAQVGDFGLGVSWSTQKGEKWRAYAAGTRLPGSFETLEEAKSAAVEALRAKLTKALAALVGAP